MKQKALAVAGCIAAVMPAVSIADVLPEDLLGLNLGEIRSTSFLNQPFKGVIPLLFTDYEASKNLRVKLAPESIFNEIGAEKLPILNSLNFQITKQGNKSVILISSDKPINLPFINFILEIQESGRTVYQDYTVLLDPESKQTVNNITTKYISTNQLVKADITNTSVTAITDKKEQTLSNDDFLIEGSKLLLTKLSSNSSSSNIVSTDIKDLKYKVKSGDSLSKIAQKQNNSDVSLKTISKLIYEKNPKAFIRGNLNRIRKGVTLSLPSVAEINSYEIASNSISKKKNIKVNEPQITAVKKPVTSEKPIETESTTSQDKYKVLRGDSLSKIAKKFVTKDVSFTKMMNSIYSNNPTAFVNNSKNKLKEGVELKIPVIAAKITEQQTIVSTKKIETNKVSKEAPAEKILSDQRQVIEKEIEITRTDKIKLKSNQYLIKSGDTLSLITKNIGYTEVPFAKMLKAIYVNNPDAFVDGKMTNLTVGAVLTLPPLSSIEFIPARTSKETISLVEPASSINSTKVVKLESTVKAKAVETQLSSKTVPTDLTKRIRELRKELNQSKKNLNSLKSDLNIKESLLQQKNIQLESLNTLLTQIDSTADLKVLAATSVKTNVNSRATQPIVKQTTIKPVIKEVYRPKPKAEIAKLKRELLNRQQNTDQQIAKIKEPRKSIKNAESEALFKEYAVSSLLKLSNSNYAYLSLALLLSLGLIRYRRELYSYTYSKINFNQVKYYPVPDKDKYDLKEKNINYYDSIMDQEPSNSQLSISENKPEKIDINPILVEAKDPIFETNDEALQIKQCENLVSELFDDLEGVDSLAEEKEWKDIEKVCDTYIEKIKVSDLSSKAEETGPLVHEVTDFNHMMSDLLESLDKVDKSVKRNNIRDEDFPDIVSNNLVKPNESIHQNRPSV